VQIAMHCYAAEKHSLKHATIRFTTQHIFVSYRQRCGRTWWWSVSV